VNDLKRQGEEFFDCQIAKQKIQLLDILKEFGGFLISIKILSFEKFKFLPEFFRSLLNIFFNLCIRV
jgi:hypothetical protein